MKKLFLLLFLGGSLTALAQLQSPKDFLGYEIGERFTRHSDVVAYFNHLSKNSDLVTYQPYGKTNEGRPLTYAIISTAENLKNIETIRTDNLKQIGLLDGDATPKTAIVWLSYNVHGNEASSTEAAMKTAYELITQKKNYLQNTVVILDPCINPDGRDRYANWFNTVASSPYDVSADAGEHHEPWPGGRANHYLFDLNRDWVWGSQVESRQRIKIYNQWMPHVHVDFHEQGINSPYYFAPAAEPFHEIISDWQRDFQTQIGKNHAKYFDANGWLFFTRERFDLLYPSYGDTYPTYMGAIGMTFEQAGHSRAGLGIQTDQGFVLTLKDRAAHHTTTGLSTIEISSKNAGKLNSEFKKYFNASDLKYKSYVLKGKPDHVNALTRLLDLHDIKYGFSDGGTVSGFSYSKNGKGSMNAKGALVVSTNQPKGKMVKVLFEPDAKLSTPLTYDITAWSLPHAFGLETIASSTLVKANGSHTNPKATNSNSKNAAGYIAKWNSIKDATFMAELLKNDIRVRFSEKKFSVAGRSFDRGSLVITRSDNKHNAEFDATLTRIANAHNRVLFASPTSFSDHGTDFGSPDVKLINKQRIALLKGKGVSSLSYGATWHFFEKQLKYPVTSIDTEYIGRINLNKYDVIILPSGRYNSIFNKKTLEKLTKWVKAGGKVIAISNAVNTFAGKEGFSLKRNDNKGDKNDKTKKEENHLIAYDQRENNNVKNLITGIITKTTLDPSHPLAFGYGDDYYSLKLGSSSFKFLERGFNVGYIKGDAKNVAGFAGKDALSKLKNSLVFGEERMGRGSFIYMVDDVLFRSFWENGKLFFANALFFANSNVFRL